MCPPNRWPIIYATAAALLALLAAWLLPFPHLISGDDDQAANVLPGVRENLMSSKSRFDLASSRYQAYISSHDVGALRQNAEQAISAANAAPADAAALARLRDEGVKIVEFAHELEQYALASDTYFAALRTYDDDLMAWTRSLGAKSERLRKDTFPFVEHIKRYPPPTGLTPDPPEVKADQLSAQITAHEAHLAGLGSSATPAQLSTDVDAIWSSGRSIEYVAGLHDEYFTDLRRYDGRVTEEAAAPLVSNQLPGRRMMATGLNLLLGLVIFGGLLALFAPRRGSTG
ncbi:MAG: hypothetical protein ACJ78Q_05755 [Chloroflexia bacterium]